MATTRMAMITAADLELLMDAATEWVDKEQRYTVPDAYRQRQTQAAKRRASVRDAIDRNRAIQRIYGG